MRPRQGLSVLLTLPFRQPLCPANLFGHLAATAVPGVEEVREGAYRRTLRLPHGPGIVALVPEPDHVRCRIALTDPRDQPAAVSRCRWLLDLDADPETIDQALAGDRWLRPLIGLAPGRRVPRCVDGAELAVRAVLGQQISTAAARTHAGRIVAAFGEPVTDPDGGLTHLFPAPASIDTAGLALPASRRHSLAALLEALASGQLSLEPGCDRDAALAVLGRLPGIGPWTTELIAMRALGDPDAFPSTDLGVRRGATTIGLPSASRELTAHAERWRPWRAYAVQHLWGASRHAINQWPVAGSPPRAAAAG